MESRHPPSQRCYGGTGIANARSSPVAGCDWICDDGGIHKRLHFALYESKMYREADVSRRTPRKPGLTPRHKSVFGLGGIILCHQGRYCWTQQLNAISRFIEIKPEDFSGNFSLASNGLLDCWINGLLQNLWFFLNSNPTIQQSTNPSFKTDVLCIIYLWLKPQAILLYPSGIERKLI